MYFIQIAFLCVFHSYSSVSPKYASIRPIPQPLTNIMFSIVKKLTALLKLTVMILTLGLNTKGLLFKYLVVRRIGATPFMNPILVSESISK